MELGLFNEEQVFFHGPFRWGSRKVHLASFGREREFWWMHLVEVFGRGVTCTWLSCDRLDAYTWRGVIVPNSRKFEAHFRTERGCTRGSLPRERGVQGRRREGEGQEK